MNNEDKTYLLKNESGQDYTTFLFFQKTFL